MIVLVYCEPCRSMTYLDKSPHLRGNAKCELCGASGVNAYVWEYSKSRIRQAVADLKFWMAKEEKRVRSEAERVLDAVRSE